MLGFGGGNIGPEKGEDELSTASPPSTLQTAASNSAKNTWSWPFLALPGPSAPGLSAPDHSAPGLEVAQSWGNPGRQVSDGSKSG